MEQALWEVLGKILKPDTLVLLIAMGFLYRKITLLEGGVRAGLLSHLTRIHSGAMANGEIAKDTLRIAEECYAQYHATGGNGYGTNIMEEIRELPIKK